MNDSPQVTTSGTSPGIRPLFHSKRDIALLKDTCVKAGFGLLKAGTVLATCVADEMMTPVPADAGSDFLDVARCRVVDTASGTTVKISEADAAKFRVGDVVVLNNNVPSYQDLGAITDIVVANGVATITVTETVSGTEFTVDKSTALSHKTAADSPFYAASCVLDRDLDTGVSASDQPAPTSVCFGNAVLYTASLTGLSAKALADLGAIQHGVHTIIK